MTREQCERELKRMIACSELPPFDGPDRTRNEALRAAIDGWAKAERTRDAEQAVIAAARAFDRDRTSERAAILRDALAALDTTGAAREEG